MADKADIAQGSIEQDEEVRRKQREAEQATKRVSVYCVECEQFIPQARQQATGGTDMCIDCASIEYQRSRRMM